MHIEPRNPILSIKSTFLSFKHTKKHTLAKPKTTQYVNRLQEYPLNRLSKPLNMHSTKNYPPVPPSQPSSMHTDKKRGHTSKHMLHIQAQRTRTYDHTPAKQDQILLFFLSQTSKGGHISECVLRIYAQSTKIYGHLPSKRNQSLQLLPSQTSNSGHISARVLCIYALSARIYGHLIILASETSVRTLR